MTCPTGWLWVGISVTTCLCVACGSHPAVGQAGGTGSVAARVAVDDPIDGDAVISESERIKRALFEADEHNSPRVRQVGGWNWRGNAARKPASKPLPKFNPFRRQKNAPPQDPFIDTNSDIETETETAADSNEESETDSDDMTEVMPSDQPDPKSKRGAAPQQKRGAGPQNRKRLQRFQSAKPAAQPAGQPSISEKPEIVRPASPSTSHFEVIRKTVSVNEADSESHLRALFEEPLEGEQPASKTTGRASKSAGVTQVDATSELEIQRLKQRRNAANQPSAATAPRATSQQKGDDIPAARARVDQNPPKSQTAAKAPIIRPLRTSEDHETAPRLPVAQSAIRTRAATNSPPHYAAANRPFQIDPPPGWSATTKVLAQNSNRPTTNGGRSTTEIDESVSQPEPLREVAEQLQFPAQVNRLGSDNLPSHQQPVAIDSIEGDAIPVQTTGTAQDGTDTLDSALFVQESSAADQEPAKIQDAEPEPVVSVELAKQNQSPWLWWMMTAFGAGFSVCLLWCIRFRNTAAA